jgi:hypothetical protein
MASISPTTQPQLEALFVAAIEAVVPRLTYQGAAGWKHYGKSTDAPSRTRRFKINLRPGAMVRGGYFGGRHLAQEVECLMSVRADYAGQHENLLHLVQDDWHQLRDVLSDLAADPANGLTQLHTTTAPPSRVSDTDHGRAQALTSGVDSADTYQMDLTYRVRYMKARTS